MDEPWIEACVLVDAVLKHVYFWAMEFPEESSVKDYYMSELAKKWKGWTLHLLWNRMYDMERILGIDYIAIQELLPLSSCTREEITTDIVDTFYMTVVLVKTGNNCRIVKTGNLNMEAIIGYGMDIIPLLINKTGITLPSEQEKPYGCLIIDTAQRHVYISESIFGLWEQTAHGWPGYKLIMGDFGYLKTLEMAGIRTDTLKMAKAEVMNAFESSVRPIDNFNAKGMAERLTENDKDIRFNPDFFDNTQP
ncbi:MAG: hypothetical protein JST26_08170 [Bacteroidetes bacterium]|nr:hypothetical protein [Bacteroidota bacterium]